MSDLDMYSGCLLGGAVGDALGAAVEFLSLDQIRAQIGIKGVTDYLPAYGRIGAITDDTQMTLFTAEGLLRGWVRSVARGIGGAEVAIIHASYLRWLQTQQCRYDDIDDRSEKMGWLIKQHGLWSNRAPGNTCINALISSAYLGQPAVNDSKGCGTVMRVSPIGLLYEGQLAYRLGKESSQLTHGHPTASVSAGALCLIISQLKQGVSLERAIRLSLDIVKNDEKQLKIANETSQAMEVALSLSQTDDSPSAEQVEKLGAGWIAEEALAISLYCALVAHNFSQGVLLAVNHSGDSDSTGSITGNLLGMIYGQNAIPSHWKDQLELREVIEQLAYDLADIPNNFRSDGNDEYHTKVINRYPGV